jgi:hypothetical protein
MLQFRRRNPFAERPFTNQVTFLNRKFFRLPAGLLGRMIGTGQDKTNSQNAQHHGLPYIERDLKKSCRCIGGGSARARVCFV